MTPVKLCPKCGAIPRACRCRRPTPPPRREYSDTAAYRRMVVDVLEAYGDACFYGDGPVDPDLHTGPEAFELAHVTAHADGGAFELSNLRPSHRHCNRAAGRRPSRGAPHRG